MPTRDFLNNIPMANANNHPEETTEMQGLLTIIQKKRPKCKGY